MAAQVEIATAICSTVAIIMTLARLWFQRCKFGWDDGWAAFGLLAFLSQMVGTFGQLPDAADYYLKSIAFYLIVWSARVSIIFSIIRFTSHSLHPRYQDYLRASAAIFIIFCGVLIGQIFWNCPNAYDTEGPGCTKECAIQFGISQLITNVISDAILLAAPLRPLQEMMDKDLRMRLMLTFATCVVTTIVSLFHAAYIFVSDWPKLSIAAIVEDSTSLIVCNLPVVITACFPYKQSAAAAFVTGLQFSNGPHAVNVSEDVELQRWNMRAN